MLRPVYHSPLGVAIALAVALTACSSGSRKGPGISAARPSGEPSLDGVRPYFVAGESFTWAVTFAGIKGGRARLAVGAPAPSEGQRIVVLRAQAESAGIVRILRRVADVTSSWIDADTGIPRRTESEGTLGGRHIVVHATRAQDAPRADVRVWRNAPSTAPEHARRRVVRLPSISTTDTLSALLLLRGWHAPPGTRAVVYTLGGARLWRTRLIVDAVEDVRSAVGNRRAVRISGESIRLTATLAEDRRRPPRRFTVWISDDPDRIPVEIRAHTEYGDVQVSITSYHGTPAAHR